MGHKTEVSSNLVIIDNTPPGVAFVAAGTTTQSNFVAGVELPVHWEGVEDSESGVNSIEVRCNLMYMVYHNPGRPDALLQFHSFTCALALTVELHYLMLVWVSWNDAAALIVSFGKSLFRHC